MSSGITVSREIRLSPSIMNEMSSRLTEKFQRKLRSTWRSNVVLATQNLSYLGMGYGYKECGHCISMNHRSRGEAFAHVSGVFAVAACKCFAPTMAWHNNERTVERPIP